MSDEYLRPVSTDKLARCEACGEFFLKTSFEGCHIRCFGLCRKCFDYYDGMAKFLEECELQATDGGDE